MTRLFASRAAANRLAGGFISFLCVIAALTASAAGWAPNETRVSPTPDLVDFEFSQSRAQFCWNDEIGNLWVGNVDRATGNFVPADGKGILVDPDSMRFADAQKTKNGPRVGVDVTGRPHRLHQVCRRPH